MEHGDEIGIGNMLKIYIYFGQKIKKYIRNFIPCIWFILLSIGISLEIPIFCLGNFSFVLEILNTDKIIHSK